MIRVVDAARGAPNSVTVTHPANWTEFQRHLLSTPLDQVGLVDFVLLTEPQAAALDFGRAAHLEPGELVLVYDLGGGTFDVALFRRDEKGFSHVGDAAGVERLGGIDFDEAVLQHVLGNVPPEVFEQARNVPPAAWRWPNCGPDVSRRRRRSRATSAVDVPVLLPGLSSTVRLTRASSRR